MIDSQAALTPEELEQIETFNPNPGMEEAMDRIIGEIGGDRTSIFQLANSIACDPNSILKDTGITMGVMKRTFELCNAELKGSDLDYNRTMEFMNKNHLAAKIAIVEVHLGIIPPVMVHDLFSN